MQPWHSRLARTIVRARSQEGQALVELALILPILAVLLFGIIEFGRAVNYWNDQNHLAEIGARYAAVGTLPGFGSCASKANIVAYVQCEAGNDSSELANGSPRNFGPQGALTVCVSDPSNVEGQEVTVAVYSTFKWLPLLSKWSSTLSSRVVGRATMRLEAPMPSGWWTRTTDCPAT
jgi:Flp pilus assembly protein TadG